MSEFDDHMGQLLAPLFAGRQPGAHRHRPLEVVGGKTVHDGWEVARCSCGKVFRRDQRMRWKIATPEWLAEHVA